jgi:hypothetical protein
MHRSLVTLLALAGASSVAVPAAALAGSNPSAPATPKAAKKRSKCDRNYSGRCLKPNVSDYDCAGGSGNGPYYVSGPFRVVGSDHYRLDADRDGTACE